MKKLSKTQLISLGGVLLSVVAGVLAALGKATATLFFLSLALLTLIFVTAVIHRYLVASRASTNRQFDRMRQLIEEQGDLASVVLAEAVHEKPTKNSATATGNSAKKPRREKSTTKKTSTTKKASQPAPTAVPPLNSPMISRNDREAVVARAIFDSPKVATRFALKVKSQGIRNNFARAASGNFYSYDQLIAILRRLRDDDLTEYETVKSWNAPTLIALAHVLGNQRLNESDLEDARTILVVVAAVFGRKALAREDRLFLSEIVGECGDWETAAYIIEELGLKNSNPVQYRFTLANRFAGGTGHKNDWLDAVNPVFAASGLNRLVFEDEEGGTDLDQLYAESRSVQIDLTPQPLVSVIIPTFEGASRIRTALRSLHSQTWQNLEILVVDDGSSKENVSALEEIIADYPTARLISLEDNRGAYVARNEGLRHAKGELITVHDDDDWSHPQKIALQVEHLLKNPNLAGSISKHARVTEDLRFTRINRRPEFSQNNMSSLLLSAEDARSLDGWHEVNRGADEEFTLRLQKLTGRKIGCCSDTPLSFTRTHDRSLTSGEILRGFQNPSRMLYHSAFTKAHELVDANNSKPRVHSLPADMGSGKRGADFGTFEFGYVLDSKLDDLTQASAIAEMRGLVESGYTVAIVHHHSFEGATVPLVSDGVLKLLEETSVQFLSFQNVAHFEWLIVRDPRAFEFAENTTTNLSAENLAIATNDAGEPLQESLVHKALGRLSQVFSRRESDIRVLTDWSGLAPFERRQFESLDTESKALIGRGRAQSKNDWPSKASEITKAYTENEVFEVLLVDDFDESSGRIKEVLRQGAEFLPAETYDLDELLGRLDFWVDMGETHTQPSLEVLSAVAAGLVVMVRPGAEKVYGDAVLYVEPDGVRTIVNRMVGFPELYELQQERGEQHLPQLWDAETFNAYIKNLREK